jgi:hypothetical protein
LESRPRFRHARAVPRPPAKFFFVATPLVILVQLVALGRAVNVASIPGIDGGWASDYAFPSSVLAALATAFVGRVLLAWLPPGEPGGHGPRELPATWAASHLVGLFALVAERAFLGDAGRVAMLAPWIVLGLLRVSTLPAAMVPRVSPPHEGPARWTRLVRACALVCGLVTLVIAFDEGPRPIDPFARAAGDVLGPQAPLVALGWLALWILVDRALSLERRAPLGRAAVALLFVACAEPLRYDAPAALGLGMGAIFLVSWVRLADRRACWLAAAGFAATGLFGRPLLALAGLAVLVLVSTSAQRRRAIAAAVACAAIALLAARGAELETARAASWSAAARELARQAAERSWGAAWWVFLPAFAWAALAFFRPRARHAIDDVERELSALWLLFLLLFVALAPTLDAEGAYQALVLLFPVAILVSGLVWIRTERPPGPSDVADGTASRPT